MIKIEYHLYASNYFKMRIWGTVRNFSWQLSSDGSKYNLLWEELFKFVETKTKTLLCIFWSYQHHSPLFWLIYCYENYQEWINSTHSTNLIISGGLSQSRWCPDSSHLSPITEIQKTFYNFSKLFPLQSLKVSLEWDAVI